MKVVATLSMALLLAGCATSYQPQGMTGGFSETQLDTNMFTVTFKGNGHTSRDKANDFALLRSAEVALENGYKYFIIVDAQQYAKNSTYTTPVIATTNANANTFATANNMMLNANTYGTSTTTFTGGQTYNSSKPRTANTIVCFAEKPQGSSYNAEFIVKSLKAKHKI